MRYLIVIFLGFSGVLYALINPEAPDKVAEFEVRMKPYYAATAKSDMTTVDYVDAYTKLCEVLDKELNIAYKKAMTGLSENDKEQLKGAQRLWIKYRDAEFKFIDSFYTRGRFGSSCVIDKGARRAELIRDRVIKLLVHYNYQL